MPSRATWNAALVSATVASTAWLWPNDIRWGLIVLLAGFVPYFYLCFLPDDAFGELRAWPLCLLTCLAGVPLVLSDPVLSDDVYRYLWDAKVSLSAVSPYAHAPDSPSLYALRDEYWSRVNHTSIATIYPPLAQAWFAVCAFIAHTPTSLKTGALVAHVLVGLLLSRHLDSPKPAALFALNPLALTESALSGHVDVLAGLALLVAMLNFQKSSIAGDTGRAWRAGAAIIAAVGTKLVGMLALPILLQQRRLKQRRFLVALMVLAASVALVAPLPSAGYGDAANDNGSQAGLQNYARRWRGNTGPFALVEGGLRGVLNWYARGTDAAPGHIRLTALRGPIEALKGTALDPRKTLHGPNKEVPDPVDFESQYVAGILARVLVVFAIFVFAWRSARSTRWPPALQMRHTLLFALLLSPQVHPWYLLWLLPLEVLAKRRAGLLWSATILIAYAPLPGWHSAREWVGSDWGQIVQYGAVLVAVLTEERWVRWSRWWRSPQNCKSTS